MKKLGIFCLFAAILLLIAVLVSLLPSDAWYVRTIDMVREPMSWIAAILLIVAIVVRAPTRWPTVGVLALVIAINVWRIWPYSAFAEAQVMLASGSDAAQDGQCFTAMAVNVKVKNKGYAAIARQIREYDPDVLFLMETDKEWIDQLEPVLSSYGFVRRHPQPHAFGLVFATRLPVAKANIVENTYRDTPTLYATLEPAGGPPIEFIGLHPKPPLPGWNTEQRDENIVNAGVQTPDRLPDALVMGDFNDVPWSRTTTRFRETGDWRDPRIGRGTYATFPSRYLFAGWPLDQLMVKGDLEVGSFAVLPDNGSDHRAMYTQVCARPAGG